MGCAAEPSFACEGAGFQWDKSAISPLATIERYCRFADRKASGEATLVHLTSGAATVKRRRKL